MPIQHHLTATALLTGSALVLTACAGHSPEPQAAVAPQTPAKIASLSPAKPHPRRADPGCRLARVDLPADRKAALFRLFDAEHGADPIVPPPRLDPCRQAAR